MVFKFNTQEAMSGNTHSFYLVGSHSKTSLPVPLVLSESSDRNDVGEKEHRSASAVWR